MSKTINVPQVHWKHDHDHLCQLLMIDSMFLTCNVRIRYSQWLWLYLLCRQYVGPFYWCCMLYARATISFDTLNSWHDLPLFSLHCKCVVGVSVLRVWQHFCGSVSAEHHICPIAVFIFMVSPQYGYWSADLCTPHSSMPISVFCISW